MSSLSLRHIRKVYPARRKAKAKEKNKAVRSTADYVAVKDFSMEIDDGEFIVFVGPSGCGKSTTLRMIAGLEDISSGELYIDGKLMNNVEPRDRDIAMVFQSYALYPHMTSYENIAFGLRMRKISEIKRDKLGNPVVGIDNEKLADIRKRINASKKDIARAQKRAAREVSARIKALKEQYEKSEDAQIKEEITARIAAIDIAAETETRRNAIISDAEKRVEELEKEEKYYSETPVQLYVRRHYTEKEVKEKVEWAANILGIEELLNSKPSDMSGGQRQRIALGRAMVRGPKVFLLDEPLSNLDAKLRTAMRSEIVKLHNELGTTFIYVTHDQVEAMTMGTRIVVMKDGIIQQIDTPTNLFDFPCNKFVAGFIGTPQMNFFDVRIKREGDKLLTTFVNDETLSFALDKLHTVEESYLDGEWHDAVMGARGESISIGEEGLTITVNIKEVLGSTTHVFVKMNGKDYIVCLNDRINLMPGNDIKISFEESKLHFFDKQTENSILRRDFANPVSHIGKERKDEPATLGGKEQSAKKKTETAAAGSRAKTEKAAAATSPKGSKAAKSSAANNTKEKKQ